MWEQLTYTSVDEIRDGVSISGWHVKDRTGGLSSEQVDSIVSVIRPSFHPVSPVPGFPTKDEIASAEVRLLQRGTPWGTVLIHTAQAGVDSMGRPNFFTHVLLDVESDVRRSDLGIDLWRAPWWLCPFGPDKVRSSSLPPRSEITAGVLISEKSAKEWMTESAHRGTLVALADAIASHEAARHSTDGTPVTAVGTVVLGVSNPDEAAQWVAALSRLCAPHVARHLSWSLWERITIPQDLEDLINSGFDVVCVPHDDLTRLSRDTGASTVVDSRSNVSVQPTSTWGLMVDKVVNSSQPIEMYLDAMADILAELSDEQGLTTGWALAMVEACDPGVLSGNDAGIKAAVDRELLSVSVPALETSDYLQSVATDWIMDANSEDPRHWASKLILADPDASAETALLDAVVAKYLASAALTKRHLLQVSTSINSRTVGLVRAWSLKDSRSEEIRQLAATARETLSRVDGATPGAVLGLRIYDWLVREGVASVPTREERYLLTPVVLQVAKGTLDVHSAEISSELAVPTLRGVADLLEEMLDPPGPIEIPRLSGPITTWLRQGVDHTRHHQLAAEVAINDFASDPGAGVAVLLARVSELPEGWMLKESIQETLGTLLTLEDVSVVTTRVINGIQNSVARALMSAPESILADPTSVRLRVAIENEGRTQTVGRFGSPRSLAEAVVGVMEAKRLLSVEVAGTDPSDEQALFSYQVVESVSFLEHSKANDFVASPYFASLLRLSLMVLILRVWAGLPLAIVWDHQGSRVRSEVRQLIDGSPEDTCASLGRLRPREVSPLMRRVIEVLKAEFDPSHEMLEMDDRRAGARRSARSILRFRDKALASAWPEMTLAGPLVHQFVREYRRALPSVSRDELDDELMRTAGGTELLASLDGRSMFRQAEKVLDRAAFWRRRSNPPKQGRR